MVSGADTGLLSWSLKPGGDVDTDQPNVKPQLMPPKPRTLEHLQGRGGEASLLRNELRPTGRGRVAAGRKREGTDEHPHGGTEGTPPCWWAAERAEGTKRGGS